MYCVASLFVSSFSAVSLNTEMNFFKMYLTAQFVFENIVENVI